MFIDRRDPATRPTAVHPEPTPLPTAKSVLLQTLAALPESGEKLSKEGAEDRAARLETALHAEHYAIVPVPDPQKVVVSKSADGSITIALAGLSVAQCRETLEALARIQTYHEDVFPMHTAAQCRAAAVQKLHIFLRKGRRFSAPANVNRLAAEALPEGEGGPSRPALMPVELTRAEINQQTR